MTGPERGLLIICGVIFVMHMVVLFGVNERISKMRTDLKERGVL